ncbi:MAG: hypothetical protein CM15mP102_02250 [Flavobacteriales bacterium]|nr:MAG: hypothetical protein CM15mP102_02250 [Flavobacteriales bacterium]
MWIPDLFMKRVENNEEWTLMCPNECPGLYDCHGDEFDKLYVKYEKKSKGRKSIKARELWEKILSLRLRLVHLTCFTKILQTENQIKNLGTIRSSNLCTEILEYTSKDEIAVCNLASLLCQCLWKMGNLIIKNFMMLQLE